ncbi:pyruvate kinase-like isoform X2 [Leptotrombidium deliense]|uniref:Pyruvate kinase n=1 Tax=Leptotrombidium deliense TaxID=299467 RepID=A0A443RVE7_9ACAR|nr:pyruvate kinase-like isoform X2 [Leptotrombidium deliense]
MLESMVKHPRPNRPECSDIANAVLDGVDCIVLTTETARGNYPIDAVSAAHQICREAEAACFNRHIFNDLVNLTLSPTAPMYTIAIAAVTASLKSLAAAIVVITSSGNSAFTIAKYRPRCPILLVCRHKRVTRQAHLYRGILPIFYDQTPLEDWQKDVDQRVKRSFEIGKQRGFLKPKDEVILIQGWRKGKGATNCIRIVVVH